MSEQFYVVPRELLEKAALEILKDGFEFVKSPVIKINENKEIRVMTRNFGVIHNLSEKKITKLDNCQDEIYKHFTFVFDYLNYERKWYLEKEDKIIAKFYIHSAKIVKLIDADYDYGVCIRYGKYLIDNKEL